MFARTEVRTELISHIANATFSSLELQTKNKMLEKYSV
jgi:hypothetical protein